MIKARPIGGQLLKTSVVSPQRRRTSATREINSDPTNVVRLDVINRADTSQICHNSVKRLNAVACDSESEGATSLWCGV